MNLYVCPAPLTPRGTQHPKPLLIPNPSPKPEKAQVALCRCHDAGWESLPGATCGFSSLRPCSKLQLLLL